MNDANVCMYVPYLPFFRTATEGTSRHSNIKYITYLKTPREMLWIGIYIYIYMLLYP